jgi:hypothetical protein
MIERAVTYYIHGSSFLGSVGLLYLALKLYEFMKYGATQL